MNLPLLFARRYFLAKRSTNAINVITGISIVVITVVTAAMVVVMSAMNGIGELVDTIYSPFDQDITITPREGKTFPAEAIDVEALRALPAVRNVSRVIEENVLLQSGGQQAVATLKGVEPSYLEMSRMPDHLFSGKAELSGPTGPTAILGIALKIDLNVPLDDGVFQPLEISAPIRGRKLSAYQHRAFERASVAVSGTYTMNMEYDSKYAVVPLSLAAEVLHYDSVLNAVELQLQPGTNAGAVAKDLAQRLGDGFLVRTRHQKNELMYRTNASEKLFTFIVLVFIALIGAFNMIASITMMMIEKKRDMRTLMSMGATPGLVRRVFFHEGLLIVVVGIMLGLVLGIAICWAQRTFGFVALTGSVADRFPVKVEPGDLLLIGVAAAWLPLRSLGKRFLQTAVKA
jgi:lipoprotein-releasing system permease protein